MLFQPDTSRIVRDSLSDPLLTVMNVLNEVVEAFPNAISFAPGRPSEQFFDVDASWNSITRFAENRAQTSGRSIRSVFAELGQYGRTNGIIQDLVSRQLDIDENICVSPESIIVTTGAQEAMAVLLAGIFRKTGDALLTSDPAYIGMTALARLHEIPVIPVASNEHGCDPLAVDSAVRHAVTLGLKPKALYLTPDFSNPLGTSTPLSARYHFLEASRRHDFLIIEDNAYGMFCYEGDRLPTIKSLDRHGSVLYIGSYSKTLFPGARLGYLVADQQLESGMLLAQELSKVKSLLSVNTSPLLQALVGGTLLGASCSLATLLDPKIQHYKRKRDQVLTSLDNHFRKELATGTMTWTRPHGGFFISVKLPFPFDLQGMNRCAAEFGVIACPASFFSLEQGRNCYIRISFSYVPQDRIDEGILRLRNFVRNQQHPVSDG